MTQSSRLWAGLALALSLTSGSLAQAQDKCKTTKVTKTAKAAEPACCVKTQIGACTMPSFFACGAETKAGGCKAAADCATLKKEIEFLQKLIRAKSSKTGIAAGHVIRGFTICDAAKTAAAKSDCGKSGCIVVTTPSRKQAKWTIFQSKPAVKKSSKCGCDKECKCCAGCCKAAAKQRVKKSVQVIAAPVSPIVVHWQVIPQRHPAPLPYFHVPPTMPHPPVMVPPHPFPHPVMIPHPHLHAPMPVKKAKPSVHHVAPDCPFAWIDLLGNWCKESKVKSTPSPCAARPQSCSSLPPEMVRQVRLIEDRLRGGEPSEPVAIPTPRATKNLLIGLKAENVVIESKGFRCRSKRVSTTKDGALLLEGGVQLQSMTKSGNPIVMRAERVLLNLEDGTLKIPTNK